MSIQTRIALCRLIEKMDRQEAYCKQLGLVNRSEWNPDGNYTEADCSAGHGVQSA